MPRRSSTLRCLRCPLRAHSSLISSERRTKRGAGSTRHLQRRGSQKISRLAGERGNIRRAMDIVGEQIIPKPQQQTWDAICDPDVLKLCIPGCETMERISDHEFQLVMGAKIGP